MAIQEGTLRWRLSAFFRTAGIACLALALPACGGGGGGSSAQVAVCTVPDPQSGISTADDIALIATPGDAIEVDVLHNDSAGGQALEVFSATSDLDSVSVEIANDKQHIRAFSTDGSPGAANVTYTVGTTDGQSCTQGKLTVYVDTFFKPIYDTLEKRLPNGRRLIDLFDANALPPYDPQLLLQVKLGDRMVLDKRWGDIDADTTRLPIASASKWLAAAIALIARDKGIVSLDDTYIDWLPGFSAPLLDAGSWDRSQVTLLQSFSMSDGLVDAHRYATMRILDFDQSVEAIRGGLEPYFLCVPAVTCGTVPMKFQPGTYLGYDNKGFQVAGRALLTAYQGQYPDWPSLAKGELFDPCSMQHSAYEEYLPNPAVASGVVSTAADYMRFLDMLRNGGRCGNKQLFSPQSLDMFFSYHTQTPGVPQSEAPIWRSPWINCSNSTWGDGSPPQDCSTWPDGEPTGGTYYANNKDNLRYTFGGWGMEEESGRVVLVASPGKEGVFPFYHRDDDYRGLFFTEAPVIETPDYLVAEQYALRLLQDRMDLLLHGSGADLAPTRDL